jgi:hypothetical protein
MNRQEWKQAIKSEDGKYYMIPVEDLDVDFDKIDKLPLDPYRFRMFHFAEKEYGISYTILARGIEEAFKYLMQYFEKQKQGTDGWFYTEEERYWKDVIIEDEMTYDKDHTLEVYEEGDILKTESC